MKRLLRPLTAGLLMALVASAPARAEQTPEEKNLTELRQTVINLLQALVDQGVMSREKAQELVKRAQEQAAGEAAAAAQADQGAVRVPYVPQIVKDEISKQVAQEVQPVVVQQVLQEAQTEKWGIPGALPDWIKRVRFYGDVRLRYEGIRFPSDNDQNTFPLLDFNAVNAAGGITRAGPAAYLNVSNDVDRLRVRARLGMAAALAPGLTAGIRLATGTPADIISANQTLGTSGARYQVGVDLAYIQWDLHSDGDDFRWLSFTGGRILNPWFAPTDLTYYKDLTFEGLALTTRYQVLDGYSDPVTEPSHIFGTLGAFPFQQVYNFSPESKWLVGGQLGLNWLITENQRFIVAGAYYDFIHTMGQRNTPESTLLNYTAPAFFRPGNTVFDISNTQDPTVNLFALAGNYRVVNLSATYEYHFPRYVLGFAAEAVNNIGFDAARASLNTGSPVSARTHGYQGDVHFGDPAVDQLWRWRAIMGYRYLQSDAVWAAWTDSDFHVGGTNATGYYLLAELGVAPSTLVRFRYLSANEIDAPRYGADVLQLDLEARF